MADTDLNFKHIIVSRVNMPRDLDPSNHVRPAPYKDREWNAKRIELLNQFTRPSLRQQTCQDFEYVTLWGKHYPVDLNLLPNEHPYYIERGYDEEDEAPFDFVAWREDKKSVPKTTMDFAFQIRDLFRQRYDTPILFTNLDSDDCLRYDFVEIIQDKARQLLKKGEAPAIIDIHKRYLLHVESGGQGEKQRKTPSPMTSSLETESIECYPLRWHHSMMYDYLPDHVGYFRYKNLLAMQTVTDTNILTQGTGADGSFEPKNYY